jgi:hypothetical protein
VEPQAQPPRRPQRSTVQWFSSLSTGFKWLVGAVITAGAVAAAIGSILALWPKPAPELEATITKVSIDRNVTLSEYRARNPQTSAFVPNSNQARNLAAYYATLTTTSQTTTSETTTGETTTGGTTTGETTTGQTTTGETTTGETTTGETTTGGTTTTEQGKILPLLSPAARANLDEGVRQALDQPPLAIPIIIGPACSEDPSDPDCGLGSAMAYMGVLNRDGSPATVDSDLVAVHFKELLASSRMQPVSGGQAPVGVTVNYNISLTGFRGRTVTMRWSLYGAGGSVVPLRWLKNEPIHWLRGEADKDSASDSFWVPIPKAKGPFKVRLGVYKGDNVRLDYADSEGFQ